MSVFPFVAVAMFAMVAATVSAVPPTEEAVEKWKTEGIWEEKVEAWKAFKEAGGSAPWEHSPLKTLRANRGIALNDDYVDTINVVVILVDFQDYRHDDTWYNSAPLGRVAATRGQFETLLFSRQGVDSVVNLTGSMTEFYLENFYDKLLIRGDVFGWYTVPEDYWWYERDNDGLGGGGSDLARHAVLEADTNVDFSLYTNGDIYVDGVIIVHAGPGAESGAYGIWSHKGVFTPGLLRDTVYVSSYTLNPEESGFQISTMGVFAHEYGHVLGCRDVYDISYQGAGLGRWSLMAGGSHNGLPGGSRPAHFDAYCKMMLNIQFDFLDVIWLDNNVSQAAIPRIEDSGVIYALGDNPGYATGEYWLVENRQRVGFDDNLPGAGLCIYHVDPRVHVQNDPSRYMVAFEQADGKDDLAHGYNGGDGGDPWPGSTDNRHFHEQSAPNSKDNNGDTTQVGVWNISSSGLVMYADLDVYYSRPYIVFAESNPMGFSDPAPGGNGNGIPEAGETIEAYFSVRNKMRMAFHSTITLSVDIPDVSFIQDSVPLRTVLNPIRDVGNEEPVVFSLPPDFESRNAAFTLTIETDSIMNSGDRAYVTDLTFEMQLGATQVLLVDDDNGEPYENRYVSSLEALRVPYEMWDKAASGSPSVDDLSPFRSVIWFTGKNTGGGGGTLTTADVTALKQYLDGCGNLFLNSVTAASQLYSLDSTFMANYLHANLSSTGVFGVAFMGIDDNEVADGTTFSYYGSVPLNGLHDIIEPFADGQAAFYLADDMGNGNFGTCGVTYAGEYRVVFNTFGLEFLSVGNPYFGFDHRDTLMRRVLDFFGKGAATSVDDDAVLSLLPISFALEQNYPNPFNPTTVISYTVGGGTASTPVPVRLTIYNTLGRRVLRLVNEIQYPGKHTVSWDGTSSSGDKVASGIYFYRLESGEESATKKMILLK